MHPNLDPDFAAKLLRPPGQADNKYSRGVVGFVTGSEKYPGAALLGINAAHETSIGMVCYLGPKSVQDFVLANRPETVIGIEKAQALVVGSGIEDNETGEQFQNLSRVTELNIPLVIDAGALQLMDLEKIQNSFVLTPHIYEAEKLFRKLGHERKAHDIAGNMVGSAQVLADLTGGVVLLKGSISVIAISNTSPIESGPGSPQLATAGTGDLLAGMIGALAAKFVAQGGVITDLVLRGITLLANQVISEAAELAAGRGKFGASEICEAISDVLA